MMRKTAIYEYTDTNRMKTSVVSNKVNKTRRASTYAYDAFGKPYLGAFNTGLNAGYTGKHYDVITGMYNYWYRDYDPQTARFTTIDPIQDGNNWFAYVNNDPVNFTACIY